MKGPSEHRKKQAMNGASPLYGRNVQVRILLVAAAIALAFLAAAFLFK